MLDTKRPRQVSGYQVADKESLNGEMVLFHPATQRILYSNRSGALIWELCDGQRTVADIVQLLSEAYPDSASQIEADVHEALCIFVQQGAIEWM